MLAFITLCPSEVITSLIITSIIRFIQLNRNKVLVLKKASVFLFFFFFFERPNSTEFLCSILSFSVINTSCKTWR